jgi:hypothetical protein
MSEIQSWTGLTGPQRNLVKQVLTAHEQLPAADEGPTHIQVRAATELRNTADQALRRGWLRPGKTIADIHGAPTFTIDDMECAGADWLPNQAELDEFIAALREAVRYPCAVPQHMVGGDVLWVATIANTYLTSIELVDASLGGLNWPAQRLWCRACRKRRRFEEGTCSVCGRWYE